MKKITDSDLTKAIIRNYSKNVNDMGLFFESLENDLNNLIEEEIVDIELVERGNDGQKWNMIITYSDDQEDLYTIKMDDFFKSII
jgi:hypothetical protein